MQFRGFLSKFLVLPLAAALAFFSSSCSASTTIRLLEAVIGAAEVAVSSLGAGGGIQQQAAIKVNAYLNLVAQSTDRVGAILEAHAVTPNPRLAGDIAAVFAGVAIDPAVLADLPPGARVLVSSVGAAVASFLAHYPVPSMAAPRGLVASRAAENDELLAASKLKLTGADRSTLAKIRGRANVVATQTLFPAP